MEAQASGTTCVFPRKDARRIEWRALQILSTNEPNRRIVMRDRHVIVSDIRPYLGFIRRTQQRQTVATVNRVRGSD
jgi:hypothetical protein